VDSSCQGRTLMEKWLSLPGGWPLLPSLQGSLWATPTSALTEQAMGQLEQEEGLGRGFQSLPVLLRLPWLPAILPPVKEEARGEGTRRRR